MTLKIPANKLHNQAQSLIFDSNNIFCLIGENGSGKSSILEAVFDKYINNDSGTDEENTSDEIKNIICFSSGQNELFYSIFDKHKQKSSKFKPDENNEIKSFYFDYYWARFLVFFAVSVKRSGKVATYLNDKTYNSSSMSLHFRFRVRQHYISQIKTELIREGEGNFVVESRRRTIHYNQLLKLINKKINSNYDFDDIATRIVKQYINISIEEAKDIFGLEPNKIFTFLAHATIGWQSNIELETAGLYLKKHDNELEFEQLSDGEYQLLSIYALLDLFDSPETLFLFDEIDSHLHFGNINKLWDTLKSIQGKLISTTHISESILKNSFDSLRYVENGAIKQDKVALEALNKISNITNNNNFLFTLCHRIKHIALMDDESDWEIFKQLAIVKIGDEAKDILEKITPIKQTSNWNSEWQLFGNEKIEFVKNLKTHITNTHSSILQNIFMICDKDEYPESSIKSDSIECKKTEKLQCLNEIETFNEQTKSYLLSWRRREILHYLLSYTMLEDYGKLGELQEIIPYASNANKNQNFDNDLNIRTAPKEKVKFLKTLMLKESGQPDEPNWTDYNKIIDVVSKIPASEISEDIVKMYDFIKSKVEANA